MDKNMAETNYSFREQLKNSRGCILLASLFSGVTYMQDIFQDVLVISSSISSPAKYVVLSTMKVSEKSLGYFMIFVFGFSVFVVGLETVSKGSRLIIVKRHRWMYVLMVIACLLNLGPVFFTLIGFFLRMGRFDGCYEYEKEKQQDQKKVELAMSCAKTREALCENLPMLVLVCFKMALSSQLILIDMISGMSSACLLSKTILVYITETKQSPIGFVKKIFSSLFGGLFIYLTLLMITTFAIESERDGIFVPYDPTREDSAGLVLILLIFPTILFCLIPFSIYDLIPFIFHDSLVIWEHFQKPPKKVWLYAPITICSLALGFNLKTAWYLFRRDPIEFMSDIETRMVRCSDQFMGFNLPPILCNRYDLKIGKGRAYFKIFPLLSITISMMAYFLCVSYIFGMRHRDRGKFRDGLKAIAVSKLDSLCKIVEKEDLLQNLTKVCTFQRDELRFIEDVFQSRSGENKAVNTAS